MKDRVTVWAVRRDGWAKRVPYQDGQFRTLRIPEMLETELVLTEKDPVPSAALITRIFELVQWGAREHEFLRPFEVYYAEC